MSARATSQNWVYSQPTTFPLEFPRLLKALKEEILHEKGKIDYVELRKDGYSKDLITRLKEI
jgi:hypothetical protein